MTKQDKKTWAINKSTELKSKLDMMIDNAMTDTEAIKKLAAHYRINGLYSYSFYNSLLIAMQGGSIAQSYKNWQKLGRHVVKGEKARIYIYVPIIKTEKAEDVEIGKEKTEKVFLNRYIVKPVFDISQTGGEALEYDHNSDEDMTIDYADLKAKAGNLTSKAIVECITGGARGYVDNEKIAVSSMSNNIDKCKTLIHELAHDTLGHVGSDIETGVKEVEAEAATALVLAYFGIDFELTQSYINGWKDMVANKDDIRRNKIIRTAQKIIDVLK